MKQKFICKLKELREGRGWTALELANKFQKPIQQDLIYKWEKGVFVPSAQNLLELSEIFGVDPREILTIQN